MFKRLIGWCLCLCLIGFSYAEDLPKFCIYYADKEKSNVFKPCKWIVFDNIYHPDIGPLKQDDKIVMGYLSVGEMESNRKYFKKGKAQGVFLQENEVWKGSYYADLRNPLWAKSLLEDQIPAIIKQGFNGLFLDTLDNSIELELVNPKKYMGMQLAAVSLVKWIHNNNPNIKIMVNRAYPLLSQMAPDINYVLAESLYTSYDFKTKKYSVRPQKAYEEEVNSLKKLKEKFPHLKIFTVDYWEESDQKMIDKIYKVERENGFIPYVSNVLLNKVYFKGKK